MCVEGSDFEDFGHGNTHPCGKSLEVSVFEGTEFVLNEVEVFDEEFFFWFSIGEESRNVALEFGKQGSSACSGFGFLFLKG